MLEIINSMDWQSFMYGVIATVILGVCGAVIFGILGEM